MKIGQLNSGLNLHTHSRLPTKPMKKHHIVPLLGTLGAFFVCWALIHFWMADFYGTVLEVSRKTGYRALMTLLALYTIVRFILIVRDKDDITRMIDKWHDE